MIPSTAVKAILPATLADTRYQSNDIIDQNKKENRQQKRQVFRIAVPRFGLATSSRINVTTGSTASEIRGCRMHSDPALYFPATRHHEHQQGEAKDHICTTLRVSEISYILTGGSIRPFPWPRYPGHCILLDPA